MKKISDVKIEIPPFAAKALRRLSEAGYEAWCVGGCVRDSLRGEIPHDWDICTAALPEQTLAVFCGFKTIPTGLKHGTVTVIIGGEHLEITTYRTDGDYLNHRSPSSVHFVRDIRNDLMRRDFTMNAICASLEGEIFDPFDGAADIERGIIRCVGEPERRFDEDALRILRAVRFAAKTGFAIEPQTAAAALKMRGLLSAVSAERILAELRSLLLQPHAGEALRRYRDIIAQPLPEISPCFDFTQNNPHHCYDVWEHITRSVDYVKPVDHLRLTMLLHDIGKPDMFYEDERGVAHFKKHQIKSAEYAAAILSRLKCDNAAKKRVCDLIREHDNRIPPERRAVRRFLARHGREFFLDYLEVRRADTLAQSQYRRAEKLEALAKLRQIADELAAEGSCLSLAQLAVGGRDIISLGASGSVIGDTLKFLLREVVEENLPNEKAALLAAAEKRLRDEKV